MLLLGLHLAHDRLDAPVPPEGLDRIDRDRIFVLSRGRFATDSSRWTRLALPASLTFVYYLFRPVRLVGK